MARKKSSTRGGTSRGKKRKSSSGRGVSLNQQQKILIGGIGIIFITAVLVLSLLSPNQGQLTAALSGLLWRTFGWGGLVVPIATGAAGLYLVLWGMEQEPQLPAYRLTGVALLFLVFEAFASMVAVLRDNGFNDVWTVASAQTGGGYLGGVLADALTQFVGTLGAVFTFAVLGLIGAILVSGLSRAELGELLVKFFQFNWIPDLPQRDVEPDPEREIIINDGRSRRAIPRQAPTAATTEARQLPLATGAEAKTAAEETDNSPQRQRHQKTGEATTGAQPQQEQDTVVSEPIFIGRRAYHAQKSWTLPNVEEILDRAADQDTNNASIREQVEIIEHTLESFGAPATVVEVNPGPTVTQFGVEPNYLETRGGKRTKVKVGKIARLADDLTLALASHNVRIQAPVPGKGYVGIEVPNKAKAMVSLRDVMESSDFGRLKSPLRIGLGQNVAGRPIAADLASMPHLLIAGTTGSGKSVCVNSIVACLLLQNTPDELKIVMVDPKRVELTSYNGIPHLAAPVVVDMDRVIATLQWALREMDARYKAFSEIGARNIVDFNQKVKKHKKLEPLPYLVIVIDELADLMMLAPEDTERAVTRLAQMARATGIHMVIATQRPSVDVVTGIIKANFPARVAFAVASSTDSRVILDTTGAERLLGQGDMLFQSPDAAAPVRLQGCFVSDGELEDLIKYWQAARRYNLIAAEESVQKRDPRQPITKSPLRRESSSPTGPAGSPAAKTADSQPSSSGPDEKTKPVPPPQIRTDEARPLPPSGVEGSGMAQKPLIEALEETEEQEDEVEIDDDLFPDAVALVRKLNKASTSLLQRRFRIGYTRAARLMDAMEAKGIIGPPTGTSKAREVLSADEDSGEEANNGDTDNGQSG